ncbi:MAG: hypothetical protein M1378_00800, partial [Bacteroidetes bacterium]|nr:hypothetical protein [Bacteroidota bacterium]
NNGHHAVEITQCICQPNMKDACTPYMMLKVFVLTKEDKIINPYAYALVTGSINSIRDIVSSLEQMLNPETGYGTLKGLVFELSVKKVNGTGKSMFPLLSLQLVKSTKKLADRTI